MLSAMSCIDLTTISGEALPGLWLLQLFKNHEEDFITSSCFKY